MEQTTALFDNSHGQDRWQETGFSSRLAATKCSGIAQVLTALGVTIKPTEHRPLAELLPGTTLLVIPPPTGSYDTKHERWRRHPSGLFRPDEIAAILRFLQTGGRLLLFAYRFGDSFTQTNLCNLVGPLGCILNDDAVIDIDRIRKEHALQSQFVTPREAVAAPWASRQVQTVAWRSMATFTILPGAKVQPLVLSPGGRCITFNRTFRQISFQSLPIAVAGTYGVGRFVLFGGPHAFETGIFGLLSAGDNASFLQNILRSLVAQTAAGLGDATHHRPIDEDHTLAITERWQEFCRVEGQGSGEHLVAFVERMLRQSGILKALGRARWLP